MTYHPTLPSLKLTTRQYHPILRASGQLKQAFPTTTLRSYCLPTSEEFDESPSPSNIKNHPTHDAPGNYRCGSGRCKTCSIVPTTSIFASHTTASKFQLLPATNLLAQFIQIHAKGVVNSMWAEEASHCIAGWIATHHITHKRTKRLSCCGSLQSCTLSKRHDSCGDWLSL